MLQLLLELRQSANLANYFCTHDGLGQNKKVAIICRNHLSLIRTLFAVSGTGADLFLLNPEMSRVQLSGIIIRHGFDLVIHDPKVMLDGGNDVKTRLSYGANQSSVDSISKEFKNAGNILNGKRNGQIIVFTGGTTGNQKTAPRKPSMFNFLSPMVELIEKCKLNEVKSVYIATPIYHGFGLAALILSVTLGARIFTLTTFEAGKACDLIEQYKVESICLVPLMLHRMIRVKSLENNQLKCIISGGATLSSSLVKQSQELLGNILYNLYGTSEAGFCILATPVDLILNADTIGRPVRGVKVSILKEKNKQAITHEKGRLCVKSRWSIDNNKWIETGDIAYRDDQGSYYLCGRVDDMIVSGGENVYPSDLENVLQQHPLLDNTAVIGVEDKDFGQRMVAYVVVKDSGILNEVDIFSWLSGRVARYQMPREVVFMDAIPYTMLGKVDKRALLLLHNIKLANEV